MKHAPLPFQYPRRRLAPTVVLSWVVVLMAGHSSKGSSGGGIAVTTALMMVPPLIVSRGRCGIRSVQSPLQQAAAATVEESTPTTTTTIVDANNDAGIAAFEAWWSQLDQAMLDPRVRHGFFQQGQLRGLEWTDDTSGPTTTTTTSNAIQIATVPSSVVLQSDYTQRDTWDVDLAVQLWHHVQQQRADSPLRGYTSLLCQQEEEQQQSLVFDDKAVPPPTAPHALRHWSPEERQYLLQDDNCRAGQRLVELADQQDAAWRAKYQALDSNNNNKNQMSWLQFRWAMETVHSRAFCGVGSASSSTSSTTNLAVRLGAPLLAAVGGQWYVNNHLLDANPLVLAGLALVAVAPLFLDLTTTTSTSAVLLPLIDSANHKESAASRIDYNPLTRAYELWLQDPSTCIIQVDDNDDDSTTTKQQQKQLFISYGTKSDTELLLNYGFLNEDKDENHSSSSSSSSSGTRRRRTNEAYRRALADKFRARHNNDSSSAAAS